jgi:hypothetical protein
LIGPLQGRWSVRIEDGPDIEIHGNSRTATAVAVAADRDLVLPLPVAVAVMGHEDR